MPGKIYIHSNVAALERCYEDIIDTRTEYPNIYGYLFDLSEALAEAYLEEKRCSKMEIQHWLPGFANKSDFDIFDADFGKDDFRLVIARSHGFKKWKSVRKKRERKFDDDFEAAVDYILQGELESLQELLKKNPDLVNMKSPFGHRAKLLHYCATNGVPTYQQKLPLNMPAIAQLLIDSEADKEALCKCYDGKFTAFQLAESSGHPQFAGIKDQLLNVLRP